MPLGELLGPELSSNDALTQDCTLSRTNQVLGRDGQEIDLSEGLIPDTLSSVDPYMNSNGIGAFGLQSGGSSSDECIRGHYVAQVASIASHDLQTLEQYPPNLIFETTPSRGLVGSHQLAASSPFNGLGMI
ncbi:hypothetical protein SUNI508_03196 [Seiridium unicorne]|uniref:Uncharacterized protein n=1 Tax=Seiridium unicorne TaxID=138068 RepID=A0ABR2VE17_9PEZI